MFSMLLLLTLVFMSMPLQKQDLNYQHHIIEMFHLITNYMNQKQMKFREGDSQINQVFLLDIVVHSLYMIDRESIVMYHLQLVMNY